MSEAWKPVKLAAKVIGHISQGMYRTPAGAIKELISNAYDAGATHVKIHTSFPRFGEFTCEDNGSGISPEEFQRLMNGGIGDSGKHSKQSEYKTVFGRPVIGRLGVGLLSLAQICSRFDIESHHGDSRKAFRAAIKFPPYTRKQIDQAELEEIQRKGGFVENGEFFIERIDYSAEKAGVKISTAAVREPFRKTMSDISKFGNWKFNGSRSSYGSFDEFIECIANPRLSALFFASAYDQLLFGLALASPLPYPDRASGRETCLLQVPLIEQLHERLKSYRFAVVIDNIAMRRPLILPSNNVGTLADKCKVSRKPERKTFDLQDGIYATKVDVEKYSISVEKSDESYQVYTFKYGAKVNGYSLSFSGYAFAQNSRLFPREYQGVLVRIRDIAIGQYDPSFLFYPQAEGPRFSMVSMEVFVEEGLDDALKVDRDGFNTLDPQYIRLQSFVHSFLHGLLFPGMWDEEKPRNKKRREEKEVQSIQRFSRKVAEATGDSFTKVEFVKRGKPAINAPLVELDLETGVIEVHEQHPESKAILGKSKYKGIAAQIVAAFEVANKETSADKRRKVFYKLISAIFE